MMRDWTTMGGSKRTMLARAVTGMGLIAAVAGAWLVGGSVPPAATPRNHADFSGAWLVGGFAPRRVALAPLSAMRLGVSAVPAAATPEKPADVRIPLAALIYDPQGVPWAYAVIGPYVYERVAVVVDRIEGEDVLISAGPRAGTPVVDVGAPELLGVEYGVGEE